MDPQPLPPARGTQMTPQRMQNLYKRADIWGTPKKNKIVYNEVKMAGPRVAGGGGDGGFEDRTQLSPSFLSAVRDRREGSFSIQRLLPWTALWEMRPC